MRIAAMAAVVALAIAGRAHAAETISYTYDEHGRLVKVERTGSVNYGVKADYEYDDADNRKRRTVTGSPNPPP